MNYFSESNTMSVVIRMICAGLLAISCLTCAQVYAAEEDWHDEIWEEETWIEPENYSVDELMDESQMPTEKVQAQVNIAEILAAHNQARTELGSPPLKWSDKVAAYAQDWANQQAQKNNCFGANHRQNNKYGENLSMAKGQFQTGRQAVENWLEEKKYYQQGYDRNSSSCPSGVCGHYTQVIWSSTREVGCAYAQCSDNSMVWVCNYNPAGNIVGDSPLG